MSEHPVRLIVIGFFLVLAGAVFPLLMVSQILESTFLLNFFSYAASVAGLFLGVAGTASYLKPKREK